ncbi:MAG: hypothetical protein ACYS26_00325 [Planctomycetota bacterium]|jgi:hypothetical protein
MLARLLASAFAVALSCSSASADIVVGPPGSGAPTSSLNDAIFNAEEGERIFVLPGEYSPFDLNGKSVQILGAGANQVFVQVPANGPSGPGSRIRGLAAGQQAVISGLRFDVLGFGGSLGACQVFENQGRVYFQGCDFAMTVNATTRPLVLTDCADLVFDDCQVLGHQPEPVVGLQVPPGNALDVSDCNARFHGGLIRGGDSVGQAVFFSGGGVGIDALDSVLTLHGTQVRGGQSFDTFIPASPAILGTNTDVILSGPAGTLVQGGPAASSTDVYYPGSPAIQFLDSASSLTRSESVAVAGGADTDGVPAPALDLAGSIDTVELFARPGLALAPNLVAPGDTFEIAIDGESGAAVAVGLALELVPGYSLPGIAGVADLDPSGVDVLFTVFLPGSGDAALPIQVPPQPSLTGTVAWFQALQEGVPGGARLSLPVALVVGA